MKKAKSLGLRKLREENGRLKSLVAIHEKDRTKFAMRIGLQIAKQAKKLNKKIERMAWHGKARQGKELTGAYFIHQREY